MILKWQTKNKVNKNNYSRKVNWRKIYNKNKYLIVMCIPGILVTLLFRYVPLFGVIIAFERFNISKGVFGSDWVGLLHFKNFVSDIFALRAVRNTLILNVFKLIFTYSLPIVLALMLNEVKVSAYKRTVQTITYLPYFISTVIVVGLMKDLFSLHNGVVNDLLKFLGMTPINFFNDPKHFRFLYILSELWKNLGWSSILYLAALSGINPELYEASTIDGANRWQKIIHINIPGILPTMVIMFIFAAGTLMSSNLEKVLLMYTPLTYETGDLISSYVYRMGIKGGNYSYSTAVDIMTSVISLFLVLGTNILSRKLNETSLW